MRLLILIGSMAGGGAERVAANLANHWAGNGWDVMIVTLMPYASDFYALHPAIRRVTFDIAADGRSLWGNLRRVVAVRQVLRQFEPDIALGMMLAANIILALMSRGGNAPSSQHRLLRVFGSEHSHPPTQPQGAIREMLRRHTYKRLHGVAALTEESAAWLRTHTNARRVVVIPNAAPWPLPVQAPEIAPESVCRAGRKVLLAAGRLLPIKGFDLLIAAFVGLAQKHVDWDLVILGEGTLRTALTAQVQASGLAQRVYLPGAVGNPGAWYEHADLFVLSSRFEGFGNTLAEALTHGLPVVSFDCDTGPRTIIRPEVDGLLVAPGDVASLAVGLHRLMSDAALRERFAVRALEARDRFSLERIARMWEEFFGEFVK